MSTYDKDNYPPGADILKGVYTDIPESLSNFLVLEYDHKGDAERLEMKRSTIAHAIMSSINSQSYVFLDHFKIQEDQGLKTNKILLNKKKYIQMKNNTGTP